MLPVGKSVLRNAINQFKLLNATGQLKPLNDSSGRSCGQLVCKSLQLRLISSTSVASSNAPIEDVASGAKQWDLYAGIVLERKPLLTTEKNEIQDKYAKYLTQLEFELSKKSDHEVRHINDKKMLEKVKAGDVDLGNVQTARDDEDRWASEAQNFTPASRVTDADKKDDQKSLERALDSHLLLVVEQKLGSEYRWICPHSKLNDGETLRQAAERMLRSSFPEIRTKVLGNAPWGFYKYKYPKTATSTSASGAKVFFYKAQVVEGESHLASPNEAIKDYAWLKRDELLSKLQPEYHKKLSECLIEEWR